MVQISLERLWVGIQNSPDRLLLIPDHSSLSLLCIPLRTHRYDQNCSYLWLHIALEAYQLTLQRYEKSIGAENLSSLLEHPIAPSYVLGTSRWLNMINYKKIIIWGQGREVVVRKEECFPELEDPCLPSLLKVR